MPEGQADSGLDAVEDPSVGGASALHPMASAQPDLMASVNGGGGGRGQEMLPKTLPVQLRWDLGGQKPQGTVSPGRAGRR